MTARLEVGTTNIVSVTISSILTAGNLFMSFLLYPNSGAINSGNMLKAMAAKTTAVENIRAIKFNFPVAMRHAIA